MRLRKEGGIFSSYLKFGIPKNQIPLKNSAKRSEKAPFFLKILPLPKNELTFETKRPCVSTKTHLRFNSNALAF